MSYNLRQVGLAVKASASRKEDHWYDSTRKKETRHKRDSSPGSSFLEADALTARPTRLSERQDRERDDAKPMVPGVTVFACLRRLIFGSKKKELGLLW